LNKADDSIYRKRPRAEFEQRFIHGAVQQENRLVPAEQRLADLIE